MSLSIGTDTETGPRHRLGRLNDGPPQVLGLLQRCRHVLDSHKEQDLILSTLARTDRDKGATLNARVDERIARECALSGDLPTEEVGKEIDGWRRGPQSESRRGSLDAA